MSGNTEEMQGVHAGRYEKGEVLNHLRDMNEDDKQLEHEQDDQIGNRQ